MTKSPSLDPPDVDPTAEELDGDDRPLERSWRRIVCAVDFSESSREAVAVAADLARRLGAELTIVHVQPRPAESEADATEIGRALARTALDARQYADAVRSLLLTGEPAAEIVAFVSGGGHDLVVMGTRGRTGMQRLVLGSVAQAVVAHAPCPVLVVRPTVAAPSRRT